MHTGARVLLTFALLLGLGLHGRAATVSALFSRGYTVIPEPRKVALEPRDFPFNARWRVELGQGISTNDVAVQTLREDLSSRFDTTLRGTATAAGILRLAISPGAVTVGNAQDRDRGALARQAYRLELKRKAITITANASQGLFYGVETLIQLLQPKKGDLWFPEGTIEDWPDLSLRHIYWDDAHHLDHMDVLKKAIRQAAFYKINGFAIKLEGHFQYKSAPAVVEPYALTPAQLQELTNYGLRYYVQLVPYLDGPAHIGFILKHPEYARLREYPESNYELCATNPDSYKLLEGMYQDLLDANQGVKYFYLSTDEPYYIGLANNSQCREAVRAKELGSVGKLLAEFVTKTATYLHDRGRTVFFWGEYPLKTEDIGALPSFMVNGEVYGPEFDPVFKNHGIRQMIYTSSEGEEKLFPDYFILPESKRVHDGYSGTPRVADNFDKISFDASRKDADLVGEVNAGWADMGLHPETFWLGYVASAAAGWRPGSPG
ncbi:MAG: glycoside hydrolase family 20 zincin-like fold domain-containing protein, partial [Bryobacteraceae bacterium]